MTKFGVVFPQREIGSDPAVIADYAQTAEGLGYDYLLSYDHVLGANPDRPGGWHGPYTYKDAFHEPFVLYGYLAGLTKRIELTTGIIILPQRQTALVAKQAAQVDLLSGGRLRLGVGAGWNPVEYEALNEDFHTRGQRYDEQVQLMRELWTQPLITFKGQYHSVPDAGINPLPVQRPIPVWFGGSAPAALKRAARLGDGWMAGGMTVENGETVVAQLRTYLAEANRDETAFGIDVWISANRAGPEAWPELIQRWRNLGATHIGINTMDAGYANVEQHLETVRRFKQVADVVG
ncbi:MAG: LLM class F420-dependent oxidoreductase [Caldilineaceae bacterium]